MSLAFVKAVGAGQFKATFRVTDRSGVDRALKVYDSGGLSARIEREVEAMKRCSHPNIAGFDDLSAIELESTSYLYSLEEYIAGGTLEERLASTLMGRNELLSSANALVDAIAHIADRQLVHRDIKPANIMLRSDSGAPVIVDFGLVRNLDATSITATWLPHGPGTPYFAPAEQLNNQKEMIDWRADQFALGVVLTLAYVGQHPYEREGDVPQHVVNRVMGGEGPSEAVMRRMLDADLAPLAKMVEQWPIRRFRTPLDLADAWSGLS